MPRSVPTLELSCTKYLSYDIFPGHFVKFNLYLGVTIHWTEILDWTTLGTTGLAYFSFYSTFERVLLFTGLLQKAQAIKERMFP